MQPSVSFALIVRNEEAKLPACLESIAGLAAEIIVGQTKRTVGQSWRVRAACGG